MNERREWLVPLTGVAFFVLAVVAFAIGGEPPTPDDAPVEETIDFYVENEGRVIFGAALQAVAASFLVFFFGYLRSALRVAEGDRGMLSLVAFAGAVIAAIGIAIDGTISFALASTVEDLEPAAVQALIALFSYDFLPLALGVQVLLLATALSVLRHGGLPKWLGWIALLLAVLAVTPIGFFASLGAGVWILIASVLLALRARATQRPSTQGA